MESMIYSSQSSQAGGGGASNSLIFGMDLTKSRVSVGIPKNHPKNSRSTSSTSTSTSTSKRPISTANTTLKSKSEITSASSSKLKSRSNEIGKTDPLPENPDAFFADLKASIREVDRVSDRIQYRQEKNKIDNIKKENMSSQETRKKKSSNSSYEDDRYSRNRDKDREREEKWKALKENKYNSDSKSRSKSSKTISSTTKNPSSSQIPSSSSSRHPTRILTRADSLQVSSDEEDEMNLGSTPPENMHKGYNDYRSQSSSSPVKSPTSSSISTKNNSQKQKNKKVLVPNSDDDEQDLKDNLPTPKIRDLHKVRGKKRSSEDDSENEPKSKRQSQSKMRRRRVESSDISDNGDKTPKPKVKSTSRLHNNKPRHSRNSPSPDHSPDGAEFDQEDEDDLETNEERLERENENIKKKEHNEAGNAFFQDLEKLSSEGEFDWDITEGQIDLSKIMEDGQEDEEDLSAEDKAYLAPYRSKTELCPYCSAVFPSNPSSNLLRQKEQLNAMSTPAPTRKNPKARELPWQKHIQFCALHHAETSIIPLGVRSGYPETIDFFNLERRLEQGWVRDKLDEIVLKPYTSEVFMEVKNEVEEVGKSKWSGMKWQSKPENLESVKPGYYGDLGRNILIHHFLSMRKWGLFTSLKTTDIHYPPSLDPLSWTEFISHVLVPESSHLLIMSDQGYTKFSRKGYQEARKIRRESVGYGTWKFREDDEDSRIILDDLQNSIDEKKLRLKRLKKDRKGITQIPNNDYKIRENNYNNEYNDHQEESYESYNDHKEESYESYNNEMSTPKPKNKNNYNYKIKGNKKEDIIEIEDSPNTTPIIKLKSKPKTKYKSSSRSSSQISSQDPAHDSYNENHSNNDKESKRNKPQKEEEVPQLKSSQDSTDYDVDEDVCLQAAGLGY